MSCFTITKRILCIFFLGVAAQAYGQLPSCTKTDCGTIQSNWSLVEGKEAIVCEGEDFQVRSGDSSPLDNIDGFHWYFIESTTLQTLFDTLVPDTSFVTYQYEVPDSIACLSTSGEVELNVALVVSSPDCAEGESCDWKLGSVIVKLRPRARFTVEDAVCVNEAIGLRDFSCHGDDYLWDFGDGNTSTSPTPQHQYTAPGTYTVRLTVSNDCGTDTQSRQVRVTGEPDAAFDYVLDPADGCLPAVIRFEDQSNVYSNTRWVIEPDDTTRWMFTDTTMTPATDDIAVRFKQPGDYTFTLVANNICQNPDEESVTITIHERPNIELRSPGAFCEAATISFRDIGLEDAGSIDTYEWTFENGSPSAFSGREFPDVTFERSGTIRLRVTGPCDEVVTSVPITIATNEAIRFDALPASVCADSDPLQLTATPTGGQWRGEGAAAAAISRQGLLDPAGLSPGTYTLTYSAGTEACPNTATTTVDIKAAVGVSLAEAAPACQALDFTPAVDYTGEIDAYAWTFDGGVPATSAAAQPGAIRFDSPGVREVIVSVEGACGTAADTIFLDIQEAQELTIEPVDAPLCSGSSPDTLRANVPGGIWRGEGIIDRENGVFDPAAVSPGRSYSLTYELADGACSSSATVTVEVVASQAVAVASEVLCIDSAPVALSAEPEGGAWSGPGVDPLTGVFDPAQTGEGAFTVEYRFTDANNCSVSSTAQVTVEALPVIDLRRDTSEFCRSNIDVPIAEALQYSATPAGGDTRWSGPGITEADPGIFNAADLAEGVYNIRIVYERSACRVTDSAAVAVIRAQPLQLSPDTTVCISDGVLPLTANLAGGRWFGGPGIDATTGAVDLEAAGGGAFTYRYLFQEGSSCEQEAAVQVEIIDLGQVVDAGPPVAICEGPTRFTLLGAAPGGGVWEGPALVDPLRGTIDLSQLQPDTTYLFQYCIESEQVAGCKACSSRPFRIDANPEAAFTTEGLPCIEETFTLVNNSVNSVRYYWDFGDGTTSSEAAPAHQYVDQGTYSIELISESDAGCRDTLRRDFYITSPPVAAFDLAADEGCAPFEVALTNSSFGDDITQRWIIAGDTISGPDPGPVFLDRVTRDSTFDIILQVENQCGQVTASHPVLVHPYPQVRFGISEDEGCSPLSIELSNTTLGSPDAFFWDMGNGNTYTDSLPPPQVYTTGDSSITSYTVTLRSQNECGADTLSKEVTVFPPDVRAFIELDTLRGCQPLTLQLESYSTPGAPVSWLFIDEQGEERGSNEENPVVTFDTPGRHTILLFASNCGTDADTAYIDVLPAPEVAFTHRPYICQGQPVTFQNTATGISGSYWEFGDGATATERSPQHVFDTPGTYPIRLTAYSLLNDCPAVYESEIEVVGNPVAGFSPSLTGGCAPLDITFSNTSAGNGQLRYRWDFGDGTSGSLERNPAHRYEKPGNYTVTLRVFDADSCFADSSFVNILVYDDPVSRFEVADKDYCQGRDSIYLVNTSQDAVRYRWRIGSDTLRRRDPVIFAEAPGALEIGLLVENTFGCRDSSFQAIDILEAPRAAFTASDTAVCEGLAVDFSNNSSGATFFVWDYGNGNTSTESAPSHTFREAGAFQVVLVAGSRNDCPADTAGLLLEVHPRPSAGFTFSKEDSCGAPAAVVFTNTSSGQQDNRWAFGDGQSSDATHPTHTFASAGDYRPQLIVSNTFGCRDTAMHTLNLFGAPTASFDLSADIVCQRTAVTLVNTSSESLRYRWRIESLPADTAPSPTVVFDQPGLYDVELIALYNDLCQDTFLMRDAIEVFEAPQAGFYYRADSLENIVGDVQFYNTSTQADAFLWDLGDGTQTSATSPFHEYDINRSIEVVLTAFNYNGGAFTCRDTTRMLVEPEWIRTFYAPNAFAPEYGASEIREFRPVGLGIAAYEIRVFAPWGEQVWRSTELQEHQPAGAWDGSHRGAIVPQGAYTWIAELTFVDGTRRTETGTVTVLR